MKKYLIKICAFSVAAVMSVCALAACGGSQDTGNSEPTETTETQTE